MNDKEMISEDDNKNPLPQIMDQLYIILIGIAFGFGAQTLFADDNKSSFSDLLIRFLILCAILLIWLHSQLNVGKLKAYTIGQNWFALIAELFFDTGSAVVLVCASLLLDDQTMFYGLIISSFIVDLLVEIMFLLRIRVSKKTYVREWQLSWMWVFINVATMVLLIAFLKFCANPNIAIILVIFFGNLLDYWVCRDFYFRLPIEGKAKIIYNEDAPQPSVQQLS